MIKEIDYEIAEQLKTIMALLAMVNIERLKEVQEEYQEEISQYEAIGIIDGNYYFKNLEKKKANYKRMESLINLIDTLHETQNKV